MEFHYGEYLPYSIMAIAISSVRTFTKKEIGSESVIATHFPFILAKDKTYIQLSGSCLALQEKYALKCYLFKINRKVLKY
jgi:hypothetical protein